MRELEEYERDERTGIATLTYSDGYQYQVAEPSNPSHVDWSLHGHRPSAVRPFFRLTSSVA
jgi:hypothetical protein